MSVITTCPTRNRPQIAKRMFDSWQSTRRGEGHMVMYVADNDPKKDEYVNLFANEEDITFLIGPRVPIVEVFNKTPFEIFPGCKYYTNVNDDHVYRTEGWDLVMKEFMNEKGGWGVVAPIDLFNKDWYECMHPSAEMVSGDLIRCLGHVFYPTFRHLGADEYLMHLGKGIDRLWLCKDVIIEHCHAMRTTEGEKNVLDDNYKHIYSDEEVLYRDQVLTEYLVNHLNSEVEKVKKAMKEVVCV